MLKSLFFFLSTLILFQLNAQINEATLWQEVVLKTSADQAIKAKGLTIDKYATYSLNKERLQQILSPLHESDLSQNGNPITLSFPTTNSSFQTFAIEKSNTLHPDLAARFPTIQTYKGVNVDNSASTLRMEISHKGVFVIIWSQGQTTLLQPLKDGPTNTFILYTKEAAERQSSKDYHCGVEELDQLEHLRRSVTSQTRNQTDGQLRTYRLALACTGEYAQFHGGTTADALAAMSTTINRVNGIFIREVALQVQIVSNNDRVIFLNGENDPYDNEDGSQMLMNNQDVCDELVGKANYDIGHVFSTGGGGVAYLNSVCFGAIKAGGVTGQPFPIGDPFDIDFVVHEMGHQFGATHTQNNDCNRSIASAFEPGSGSTIMSYSGICFPNVQNSSDPYFHGYSIQQITNYIAGTGNSCAMLSATNNNPPDANAGRDYFVPIGTPFELTGGAIDTEGQTLTYCWEQMDNEFSTMPPEPTAKEGPAFRSVPPTIFPSRSFPSINSLVKNEPAKWEVLPMIGRSMEFGLTVRDNFEGGGAVGYDELELTFIEDAGPFKIQIPSEALFYPSNSIQTVRWEVANTNKAPINVSKVDIYLSLDGGYTYPELLAENVPNDGSQDIQLPNVVSDSARIKIKSINNVFFDISDNNFSILEASPDFSLEVNPKEASVCQGNAVQFTTTIKSIEGFAGTVEMGTNAGDFFSNFNFSKSTVEVGSNSLLTINTAGKEAGIYKIEVTATSGESIKTRYIDLIISPNTPIELVNSSPATGATDLSLNPTFEWSSSDPTATYLLEVSTDPSFNQLVIQKTGIPEEIFISDIELEHSKTYYWRVQATNDCGTSNYSAFNQFTISNVLCQRFTSADIPEIIPEQGTPEIGSVINLEEEGVIKSVSVLDIQITHSWINDLTASLQSPDGTKILLFDQICGDENSIDLSFGGNGADHSTLPCPPESDDLYQAQESLSKFENKPIAGTWTLFIKDHFNQDGGKLNNWALEVCRIVKEDIALAVVITDKKNPSCTGDQDGYIFPTIIGGEAPYDINWSNGSQRLAQENLGAGTYTVTVKDATNVTVSATITLQPATPITLTATKDSPNCSKTIDGSITVVPNGGTPPYQYNWAHGPIVATVNNLPADTYTVSVTDANKCQSTMQIELKATSAMSVIFATTDVTNTANGSITVGVSGGTAPYTYAWSNNVNSRDLSNLPAGTYALTVTDAAGCTQTGETQVNAPRDVAADCKNVIVEIILDNYGEENTWDIKNSSGTTFAQGGPYKNFLREELQTTTICLDPGCYDFSIYDQWGDGMCCSYGNGAFSVIEEATGKLLVSGNKFTKEAKTTFCIPTNDPDSEVLSYCGANGKNTVYEWIEAIQINGQVFQTGSNDGYFNNESPSINAAIGSTIELAFTPGFGFNAYSENWQVWMDWNRDGDLEDSGEQVFFGSGDRTVKGTVIVPDYAVLGTIKMRVAMKWGNQITSCESFNWGEVEDFTLNILPKTGFTEEVPTTRIETKPSTSASQETSVEDQINIFPNPATDRVFLKWAIPSFIAQEIAIYNSLGKRMLIHEKALSIAHQKATIPIQHLPNGLYLVILKGEKKSYAKGFVVAK